MIHEGSAWAVGRWGPTGLEDREPSGDVISEADPAMLVGSSIARSRLNGKWIVRDSSP
jgi:hypothetical protein